MYTYFDVAFLNFFQATEPTKKNVAIIPWQEPKK